MIEGMAIKRENYVTIQGWMVTDLKLKGNGLLIYAIIYGFSQEEGQWFTGSRQYLADWTNSTKRAVEKTLAALTEAGLLDKKASTVNGVKVCEYRAVKFPWGSEQSSPEVANKVRGGSEQSSEGVANKVRQGSEQSSPNNLTDNSKDNLPYKNNTGPAAQRPRFVKPTLDEIKAYCRERGNKVDPERFLAYYESNGWKVGKNPMKDWRAAVRNWERNSFSTTQKRGTGANWDDLDGIL